MVSSIRKFFVVGASLAALTTSASAADGESCKTVRFADVGWTEIQVISEIASNMFTAMGYTGEVKTLSVPITFASLKSKDVDVFFGNWMPSQSADIQAYLDDK